MQSHRSPRIAIVGSGLAGHILAAELSQWAEVVVFERGPPVPLHPEPVATTANPLGLHPSFCYGLGGTTNLWHGGMIAMAPQEFGSHWPPQVRDDLKRWQDAAFRRLYGEERLNAWERMKPDPAGQDLFLDFLFRPAAIFRAASSGSFNHVDLRLGHRVTSLREADGAVIVSSDAGEGSTEQSFDGVVVCAGGLNSPLILKASGLGGAAVGRNVTDHPMGFVAKVTRRGTSPNFDLLRRWPEAESVLKMHDQESGLWFSFFLRPTSTPRITSDPYADSFKVLGSTGRMSQYVQALLKFDDADFRGQAIAHILRRHKAGQHAYVLAVTEQECLGQGRVEADGPNGIRVDWTVSDAVVEGLKRSLARLAVWLDADLHTADGDLRVRLWSAAHHSGGCRMSLDPTQGAVDENLRVYGCERVFVCDGSVLPSTGVSNTGLTISACALRLADHLRQVYEASIPKQRLEAPGAALLVSGASGGDGRIIMPILERAGFAVSHLDARASSDPGPSGECAVLLNLGITADTVSENAALQQRIRQQATAAGVRTVIVLMSLSTLGRPLSQKADATAFNLGFEATMADAHAASKLESEKIWLEWQKEGPERSLVLLYLPTILGPRSGWTRFVSGYRPGLKLRVPRLDPFYAVGEPWLVRVVLDSIRTDFGHGVTRRVVFDYAGPLSGAIARDRGASTVRQVSWPGPAWALVKWSGHNRKALRAARVMSRLSDRAVRLLWNEALLPAAPDYMGLFALQANFPRSIFDGVAWMPGAAEDVGRDAVRIDGMKALVSG